MKILKLLPIAGLLLFIYIISYFNLASVISTILKADIVLLLIGLAMVAFITLLKAVKWKVIIAAYDVSFPLRDALMAWLVGFFIGFITPGRVGDLGRSYYLRGVSIGKSLTTVVIDRFMDILVLLIIAVLSMFLFLLPVSSGSFGIMLVLILVVFLVAAMLATRKGTIRCVARPFFRRVVPEKYKLKAAFIFEDFYAGLGSILKDRKSVALALAITVFYWFFSVFQYFIIALALGMNVTYGFMLIIMPVVILLEVIPISFSGLGTREAALIAFMSLVGIAAETAISFSLLLFFLNYITIAAVGFILWTARPMKK